MGTYLFFTKYLKKVLSIFVCFLFLAGGGGVGVDGIEKYQKWMGHFSVIKWFFICENKNRSICRKRGVRGRGLSCSPLMLLACCYIPCIRLRNCAGKSYVHRVNFLFIFSPLNPVSNSLVFATRNYEWCRTLTWFRSKLSPKILRLWWNENSTKERAHRTLSRNDQGANRVTLETQGLSHVWDK